MDTTMHAVGLRDEELVDVELPVPAPGPSDLLVRVEAVSVNPVDVKQRLGADPAGPLRVLGYDAAGVVEAVGADVNRFAVGDEVYYAGSIVRPGTNARFHVVDEHVVGHKPATLSFAEAAAVPLTTLTAWEILFDSFALRADSTGTLLVLAAAGGVGSMLTQLARVGTDLRVIGTASRPESREWVTALGAHDVIGRGGSLADAVLAVAPEGVDYVATPFSDGNIDQFARLVKPRGHIAAIDEPEGLDLLPLKSKSISWHWELMFTRPLYSPHDWAQHEILERAAALFDAGKIRSTLTRTLGPIDARTLREAHAQVEGSGAVGKVVVSGWSD